MFGNNLRDMKNAIEEMERQSRVRSCFNGNEAKQKFREYLAADRRFDAFDHERLIDRTQECRNLVPCLSSMTHASCVAVKLGRSAAILIGDAHSET